MLSLIADVVVLEPEEECKPVQEVHGRVPLGKRWFPEVPDGAKRRSGGSNLGIPEGRVVS